MAIFLSYSRADEVTVKALIQGLEAGRRDVWLDRELTGGESWWDAILDNIRRASVFVFALSQDSLNSTPCRTELEYARAVNRPVVPVQVGKVDSPRTTPFGAQQIVPFKVDEALSAFALIAALEDAARKTPALPDPLPEPPPIPFGYLMALRQQIEETQLDPNAQLQAIDQLRRALTEERDRSVHADIKRTLLSLREKSWTTRGAEQEINRVLGEVASTGPSGEAPKAPAAEARGGPVGAAAGAEVKDAGQAAAQVPAKWYPDPSRLHQWRWYENKWTAWVSDGGVVSKDPLQG